MKEYIKWLFKVFPLPIIIMGTLGNILCVIVCRRKRVKEHAFSVCLIVLAVSDTIALHIGLWRWWMVSTFEYELRRTNALCKLILFFLWFSGDLSGWILSLITVQRFISVWLPTRANPLCSHKACLAACGCLILLSFLKNLHFLVVNYTASPITRYAYATGCEPVNSAYLHFLTNEWVITDLIMGAILPFITIAICNGMIIGKLCRAKKCESFKNCGRKRKFSNINVMLTLKSMIFLCLVMPWYMVVLVSTYVKMDRATLERMHDADYVTMLIWYTNPAINFYLYCLGGPLFRRELRSLCTRGNKVKVACVVDIDRTAIEL